MTHGAAGTRLANYKLPVRCLMRIRLPALRAVFDDSQRLLCSAAMAAPHAVRVTLLQSEKVLV